MNTPRPRHDRSHVSRACVLVAIVLGAAAAVNAFSYNIYGNWCGPGHPPVGVDPPTKDAVDAACRGHDLCYAKADKEPTSKKRQAERYNCDEAHWKNFLEAADDVTNRYGKKVGKSSAWFYKHSRMSNLHDLDDAEIGARLVNSIDAREEL